MWASESGLVVFFESGLSGFFIGFYAFQIALFRLVWRMHHNHSSLFFWNRQKELFKIATPGFVIRLRFEVQFMPEALILLALHLASNAFKVTNALRFDGHLKTG